MRRSLAVLCAVAVGATALAASAPATAAPAPAASQTAHAAVPGELLVSYEVGATATERERARGRAGAQRQEQVVGAAGDRSEVELVRLPAGADQQTAIRRLESDAAVKYAEPNWIYQHAAVTDPYYTATDPAKDLWGMHGGFGSNAEGAWSTATGTVNVYVGVIDEGIQLDHPDLAGQVWVNPRDPSNGIDDDGNGYVDDLHGWDFDGNNNTIYDGGTKGSSDDHGTHVAGTIGAKADGSGVVGVNHAVTLISGKFLGRRGGTTANAIRAVDYFTDLKSRQGLNIVATNNSWGGGGFSSALYDAIDRANNGGILFIAAAGNNGSNNDTSASYPSNYDLPNVIAVAAIDRHGALASFSQYGATTVDLGAPGVDVWSTTAYNSYSQYGGTSMATPHVSGAAALYAAAKGGSAASIKTALLNTAPLTQSLCGKTVTQGRLDIAAALGGIARTGSCATTSTGGGSTTGGTVDVTKGAKSGAFTPVTVTWSGFLGEQVLVRRSGAEFTEPDPGSKTETWRGTGVVTYTVCELDGQGCVSDSVTI